MSAYLDTLSSLDNLSRSEVGYELWQARLPETDETAAAYTLGRTSGDDALEDIVEERLTSELGAAQDEGRGEGYGEALDDLAGVLDAARALAATLPTALKMLGAHRGIARTTPAVVDTVRALDDLAQALAARDEL